MIYITELLIVPGIVFYSILNLFFLNSYTFLFYFCPAFIKYINERLVRKLKTLGREMYENRQWLLNWFCLNVLNYWPSWLALTCFLKLVNDMLIALYVEFFLAWWRCCFNFIMVIIYKVSIICILQVVQWNTICYWWWKMILCRIGIVPHMEYCSCHFSLD